MPIHVDRYAIRIPLGNTHRGVTAVGYADFDKDGDIDILMGPLDGSPNRTAMEFYRNNSGSFAKDDSIFAEAVPGMVHARKMLVGDYNKDGWPDAFVIGHGWDREPWPGEYPILLLSDGQGKLVATHYDEVSSFQHGGASADIDHDNDLDIFVFVNKVFNQAKSFFLINDGTGKFSYDFARVPSGATGFTAELIDLDEDGFIDLITAQREYQSIPGTIFWGENDGQFSDEGGTILPAVPCWGEVLDFDAEDLDGDGDLDIVVNRSSGGCETQYQGFYVQVLRNEGNRTFSDATSSMIVNGSSSEGVWLDWLRIQDINGDGRPDLIADNAFWDLTWLNRDGILER